MPWDGADMLRMLQFFELTYSRVRPYALGLKARPRVPEKFLLLTHVAPNALAITLGVLPLLAGASLI